MMFICRNFWSSVIKVPVFLGHNSVASNEKAVGCTARFTGPLSLHSNIVRTERGFPASPNARPSRVNYESVQELAQSDVRCGEDDEKDSGAGARLARLSVTS